MAAIMATIRSALELYILDGKARQCTAPTLDHYRSRIGDFDRWLSTHLGELGGSLDAVTHTHIRTYLAHLVDKGLSSATVHTHGRALRAFLNFCKREGLIAESPFDKVRIGRPDRLEKFPYNQADIDKLLAVADLRDAAIVLTLLDTGMRASECIALNVSDLDGQRLHVRKGKGRKARSVPIGKRTTEAVTAYLAERAPLPATAPLFASKTNRNMDGRLTRSGLRRVLVLLGDAAGVDGVHPHRFRRTFAVWSLSNGMDIFHLQRLMGHEDLETLRGYLALVDSDLRRAHAQFGPVDHAPGDS
jgi:integrase/recombinase XerC